MTRIRLLFVICSGFCVLGLYQPIKVAGQGLRVAVMDSPGDGPLAVGLADMVEVCLQKQGIETYTRPHLRLIIAERGLDKSGRLEPDSIRRVPLPAMGFFVRGAAEWLNTHRFSLIVEAFRSSDGVLLVKQTEEGEYPRDWLSAIERGARTVGRQLLDAPAVSGQMRQAGSVLWMPEANWWFLRGMQCYGEGDFAQAAVCFWKACRWDAGFRGAWLWEARSYQAAGLPEVARAVVEGSRLAGGATAERVDKRIVVVVPGKSVTVEQRAAFERGLVSSAGVSLFEPQWIGASAQEADLQLTGEMAPRCENRNVWLVVDDVVTLDLIGQRLVARSLDVNRATVTAQAECEVGQIEALGRLAEALGRNRSQASDTTETNRFTKPLPLFFPPGSREAELVVGLREAQKQPHNVRCLIHAADCWWPWAVEVLPTGLAGVDYPVEWHLHQALLDRAIEEIRRRPEQQEAEFWLASALWRKRIARNNHLVAWNNKTAVPPLKQDFGPLLDLFPQGANATNLAEVVNTHKWAERTMPAEARYLDAVFTNALPAAGPRPKWARTWLGTEHRDMFRRAGMQATNAPAPVTPAWKHLVVREFKRAVAEQDFRRAWAAQHTLGRAGVAIQAEAPEETGRFKIGLRNLGYRIHNETLIAQLSQGNPSDNVEELLQRFQPPIDGVRRAVEIAAICDALRKRPGEKKVLASFLEAQSHLWLAEYGTLDVPAPLGQFEGVWDPVSLVLEAAATPDGLWFGEAEAANILESLQGAPGLPVHARLRARFGEGLARCNLGEYYAATELLRGVLAELESIDLGSHMELPEDLPERALAALRTARLFGDSELDFRLCCGPPETLPLPGGPQAQELESLFKRYLKQWGGASEANQAPLRPKDLARDKQALRALVSRQLAATSNKTIPGGMADCIRELGRDGAPLVPQLVSIILSEQKGSQSDALAALGLIGPPAAGALPVVLLCLERSHEGPSFLHNTRYALKRLGPPPSNTMPYLARLLWHPNAVVASNAADIIKRSGLLPSEAQSSSVDKGVVSALQDWWESTGRFQVWTDQSTRSIPTERATPP